MICPFCKEEIKDGAVLCKFCKSNLSGKAEDEIKKAPSERVIDSKQDIVRPQPYALATASNNKRNLFIGIAFVVIVVTSILILNPKSNKEKMRITMGDMKSLGVAIESYVADWAFAPKTSSIKDLKSSWFVPFYIKDPPLKDAWGRYLDFNHGNTEDEIDLYSIISGGPDKTLFTADDIIYSDGSFVNSFPTYKKYSNQTPSQARKSQGSGKSESIETESNSIYIDLPNWNLVKINPEKYSGKKVKIKSMFMGIWTDGTVILDIGGENTYEDQVAEKIANLNEFKSYTWYGEVFITLFSGPALKIEKVE